MFQKSPIGYHVHINAMLHDVLNFRRSAQTPAIRVASYVAHGNRDACMWCCSYSLEALVDSRLIGPPDLRCKQLLHASIDLLAEV